MVTEIPIVLKMINEYNIHNTVNSFKSIFYFLITQNIADISNKLIFVYVFKFMKTIFNLKPSKEYTNVSI